MDTVISPINIEQRRELDIRAGDTVRVHQKIQEKGKTRIQIFEGLVIARKHGREAGGTFTVRRTSLGIGVEKIFPLYSPNIDKIEITKRSKVRRSKLYHIRDKAAKEIRRQMRNVTMMDTVMDSADAEEGSEEQKKEDNLEQKQEEKNEAPTSAEAESESRPESVEEDPKKEEKAAE